MTFDETVVRLSAPALCGIKPACLFSLKGQASPAQVRKVQLWNRALQATGRRIVIIRRLEALVLFFVYDDAALRALVLNSGSSDYLCGKGYPTHKGFCAVLAELFGRLAHSGLFPHEVGLFLGYPLADVIGFETRHTPCQYTGSWMVYRNVAAACQKMRMYRECSRRCCKLLDMGMDVPDISKNYTTTLMEAC